MKLLHSRIASVALASVSALALSQSANAQAFTWTGYYIGVNAGGTWSRSNAVSNSPCDSALPGTFGYFCNNGFGAIDSALIAGASTGGISGSGFVGGGTIGKNWQTGSFVYGLEGDLNIFKTSKTAQSSGTFAFGNSPPSAGDAFTAGSKVETFWLATVRGRLGWSFGNVLVFGTGGLAVSQIEATNFYADNVGGAPGAFVSGNTSKTKTGWTVGGGAEWAIGGNWTLKAEYLYVDLGTVNVTTVVTNPTFVGYSSAINTAYDTTSHIARLGVSFKF